MTASAIEDAWSKAEALSEIAKAQADAGEKDAAMRTFDVAKETAEAIEDTQSKAGALERSPKPRLRQERRMRQ
ncbi:MAG: hypothetical protein IPG76_22505 [Acidobacteria bacterium]|nr:hypothetical protein [Acidobacteriota bacterium]